MAPTETQTQCNSQGSYSIRKKETSSKRRERQLKNPN
jgi:hypothetical protein